MTPHAALIKSLMGRLIVSCQARAGNPLHGPVHISALALAAEQGGAAALRIQGEDDIRAVKERCTLPVIGIRKVFDAGPVYITPTFADAAIIVEAGADIVALDATLRPRQGPDSAGELIRRIRGELGVPVMADVDSLASGRAAAAAGAELIATTLSGYTPLRLRTGRPRPAAPDFALLEQLWAAVDVPIVAEGRFWEPGQVEDAFLLGASRRRDRHRRHQPDAHHRTIRPLHARPQPRLRPFKELLVKIIATDTAAESGFRAALLVAALVKAQPTAVLGLATGSSPQPLYAALEHEEMDLGRVRRSPWTSTLGLGPADEQSYAGPSGAMWSSASAWIPPGPHS